MTADRMCSIDECGRPVAARGYCNTHYNRWWRTGTTEPSDYDRRSNFVPLTELGVTYRQLDYWCRVGTITLSNPATGSGSRRKVSELEARAIQKLVSELADIRCRETYARTGGFFAATMRELAAGDHAKSEAAA